MGGDAIPILRIAHHQAMLASQTRMLTSGTHFGGYTGFLPLLVQVSPQFWRRLGLGWNDADKALSRYGVIQEWTKEVRRITVHEIPS